MSNISLSNKMVSTTNKPARDSPIINLLLVVLYFSFIAGNNSFLMNFLKSSAPPALGMYSKSYATFVGPVKSLLRSVFSIPTNIHAGILFSAINFSKVFAMCGKSSLVPPSGIYSTGKLSVDCS